MQYGNFNVIFDNLLFSQNYKHIYIFSPVAWYHSTFAKLK